MAWPPRSALLVLVLAITSSSCLAVNINVYVVDNPPFVQLDTTSNDNLILSGFDVELSRQLLESTKLRSIQSNLSFTYVVLPNKQELFSRVQSDEWSIGLSGIAIDSNAPTGLAFSATYFSTGTDLVFERVPARSNLLLIFRPLDWWIWGSGLLLLYFSGHVFWWFERRVNPRKFPRAYLKGVNQGVWYAWGTLTQTKVFDLKGVPSRLYSVGWSSLSIIYVAAYTANLMSILLVQQLQSEIKRMNDVNRPSYTVGVIADSPGASWAPRFMQAVRLKIFSSIQDAWAALDRQDINGILYDHSILQFMMNTREFTPRLFLLGQLVTAELYGVVLPENFVFRQQIDEEIVRLGDSGLLKALQDDWFRRSWVPTSALQVQELTLQAFAGMYLVVAFSFAAALITFCYVKCCPRCCC